MCGKVVCTYKQLSLAATGVFGSFLLCDQSERVTEDYFILVCMAVSVTAETETQSVQIYL